MSNTVKLNTCPRCGVPIPAEAPQGLCPKCVLRGAAVATETGLPATATSEIPTVPRIAAAFPQLEIGELIGRGGMGFVFKARQPHLDRFVALKLLPDKLAKDAQFAERFNREGRVLARLNHPSIVSVFDFGQTGGFYYLIMEYVDGVNLRQAMNAGRFSPAEALSVVPKVCEALQYAHEQGVLHRDIKPENILLDAKGRVKIADFGIAKLLGEEQANVTLTNTGAALGTPHYMAPEQLEKPSTVDHRADIYSLGVVFYEMLTGELPIGRFAAPSAKTPVNASVDQVVFRTLEKEPRDRFQSAGEMKTQVEHLGAGARADGPAEPSSEGFGPAAGRGDRGEAGPAVYSRWSIYGALMVGLSLPVPLMTLVWVLTGRGALGWWPALASVALPGLGGTLLGWLGLHEIRESGGRIRGLPLALFATFLWPLTLFAALTVGGPMFLLVPGGEPTFWRMVGRFLVLLLPAAVIAFGVWSIHATALWANRKTVPQRSGILKWIFIGVLVIGMGVVLQFQSTPVTRDASAAAVTQGGAPVAVDPVIQFTFTNVELRDDAGQRWLTMSYDEQVHGACQHTFRYDARVKGFMAQTRMDSSLSDAKPGFAPVLIQRVLWKLPASLPPEEARALRDLVAKQWQGKSVTIEAGDERVIFKSLVPDGGTIATAIGVKLQEAETGAGSTAQAADGVDEAAEIRVRLAREQLEMVQQNVSAGLSSRQSLAEAEHRLAVAEARGDAVVLARANLQLADYNLKLAQANFAEKLIAKSTLRVVESEQAIAEIELKKALKNAPATPTTAAASQEIASEKETVLTHLFSGGEHLSLDGAVLNLSLPASAKNWGRTEFLNWLADAGGDLAVIDYGTEQYGWGLALRATTRRLEQDWLSLDAQSVRNALAGPKLDLENMDKENDRMNLYRLLPGSIPLRLAMKTSQGRLAALEITGLSDQPRGVKVRYKVWRAVNSAKP